MKYFLSLFIIFVLLGSNIGNIHAATNTQEITRESNVLMKNIKDPTGKVWIKNTIKDNITAIKNVEGRHSSIPLNRILKKELLGNINMFINDIKNNAYSFDILDSDRQQVESSVLGYQKDFLSSFKTQMSQYVGKDQKQSGNMNFSLRSSEVDVGLNIESYKTIVSQDGKNLDMTMRLNISVKENKTNEISKIMIDGSMIILGEDIYISLKDYSLTPPKEIMIDTDMIKEVLSELKGKVFHQKVSKLYGESIIENANNNQLIIKIINDTLDVLLKDSFLTPIAKKGNIFVLGINSKVLREFTQIFNSEYSEFFQAFPIDLLPGVSLPWNITSDGTSLWINHLDDRVRINSKISRNSQNIATIELAAEEVGVKYPWKGHLNMTPQDTKITGTVAEYLFDYIESTTSLYSTLKKSNKIIATLKIDNNGFNAWTYDLSGMWDYSKYNWDTDSNETESIVFQFLAKIQAEFGQFTILKPSISQELEKLSYFEKSRDNTRINAVQNIAGYIDYYKEDYNKYPRTPKNGCVNSITTPNSSSISFDYYKDPQSLGVGICKDNYFYRNMKDSYVIATRVEQKSNANYDNSKLNISTGGYDAIVKNIKESVISLDPSDWLYVIIAEDQKNYYND